MGERGTCLLNGSAELMIFLGGVIVPDKDVQYPNIHCFFCAFASKDRIRASGESGGGGGMACRMELRAMGGNSSWQSCYENRGVISYQVVKASPMIKGRSLVEARDVGRRCLIWVHQSNQ